MANTKISQLPSWSGTAADSRWFVMNNAAENETFKYQGFASPIKYITNDTRIQNVSDVTAKVNGDYQINIGGFNTDIQSTAPRQYIFGGYENTITTKSQGYGTIIIGGGNNIIGGPSDANASYGASIFASNSAENNAYYSAIIGSHAPFALNSKIRIGTDNNNGIAGAFIGGGYQNYIEQIASQSFIVGGFTNTVRPPHSGVIGGSNNLIDETNTGYDVTRGRNVIVGGNNNTIKNSNRCNIIGGTGSTIDTQENIQMIGTKNRTGTTDNTVYVENAHTFRTYSTSVQAVSSGSTFTCNLNNGGKAQFYLTANTTIDITNVRDGQSFIIKTQTDGNYTITWTATGYTFVFEGGLKDPGNTTIDLFVFEVFGSVIYGNRRHNYS